MLEIVGSEVKMVAWVTNGILKIRQKDLNLI